MRVTLATNSLEGISGSETYALTVADQLQRLGHQVCLYACEPGRASELAEAMGIPVAVQIADLPKGPDVFLVQDGVVACRLAAAHPAVPQVFVAHSDIFDLQLPLQLPHLTSRVVTLYERVDERIRALALQTPIDRLSQPVDVERFKPLRALPERARVAIAFGNYLHGERLALLQRACGRAGIELRRIGIHGHRLSEPAEQILNRADIVFGKARVIIEAMACGRAAYVYDHNGCEGWVNAERYAALAADNFGGQSNSIPLDEDRLTLDLAGYGPAMGLVNRDLAVRHHAAARHACALVAVLRSTQIRETPVDGPLEELARVVRLRHRAEVAHFSLQPQMESLALQVDQLAAERDSLRAELAAVRGAELVGAEPDVMPAGELSAELG